MKSPQRCPWVDLGKPLYVSYHDQEWGVPVHDDRKMFELLLLESAVNNARRYLELVAERGSFADYLWSFVGGKVKLNRLRSQADYPARSAESDALSMDLKRRGFRFVGSTIMYAHMQASGLVNDHALGCFRRAQLITSGA